MLAALFGQGVFGYKARAKMKLLRQRAAIDSFPGYPVVRAWFPWEAAGFAVEKLRPDVAVVQCHKSVPIGKALQAEGVPLSSISGMSSSTNWAAICASCIRRSTSPIPSSRRAPTRQNSISNSTVIPPTINPALYSTPTTGDMSR